MHLVHRLLVCQAFTLNVAHAEFPRGNDNQLKTVRSDFHSVAKHLALLKLGCAADSAW
jgi:hypothetical protein